MSEAMDERGRIVYAYGCLDRSHIVPDRWAEGYGESCFVHVADLSECWSPEGLGGIRGPERADDARASTRRFVTRRVLRKPHRRVWCTAVRGPHVTHARSTAGIGFIPESIGGGRSGVPWRSRRAEPQLVREWLGSRPRSRMERGERA